LCCGNRVGRKGFGERPLLLQSKIKKGLLRNCRTGPAPVFVFLSRPREVLQFNVWDVPFISIKKPGLITRAFVFVNEFNWRPRSSRWSIQIFLQGNIEGTLNGIIEGARKRAAGDSAIRNPITFKSKQGSTVLPTKIFHIDMGNFSQFLTREIHRFHFQPIHFWP